MGGRGGSGFEGSAGVTTAQNKKVNQIANRTRNLKNEQYRIINENGEVVLEKKGSEHEVASTVGEKRQYLDGAVSIHNHPNGGTFSDADLKDFGYGARQIVAASPEGNYKLSNQKWGTKDQSSGWRAMQQDMDAKGITKEVGFSEINRQAQNNPAVKRLSSSINKTSQQWVDAKKAGKSQATLDKIYSKYEKQQAKYKALLSETRRKIETKPYHDYYKKNASKFGFKYEFVGKG